MSTPSTPANKTEPAWGNSYRLVAAEKWKAKSAAMGKAVTQALVDYAAAQRGMRVLDLASGTGEPAISLAHMVGSQGHVTALDLSADLLEIAKARASERGLQNFEVRQADAHALPFPADHFHLVTCRFGVMFFRDPPLALRETQRVLREQARACFLAWGPFEQPYWLSTMGIVHRHIGGPLFPPGGQNPFRFATPGSLTQVLREAGFRDIHEETKIVPWAWPGTAEEVWEQARAVAVPFRPMLDRVPQNEWPEIQAEVYAAIRKYERNSNLEFGATVVLASGTK